MLRAIKKKTPKWEVDGTRRSVQKEVRFQEDRNKELRLCYFTVALALAVTGC